MSSERLTIPQPPIFGFPFRMTRIAEQDQVIEMMGVAENERVFVVTVRHPVVAQMLTLRILAFESVSELTNPTLSLPNKTVLIGRILAA